MGEELSKRLLGCGGDSDEDDRSDEDEDDGVVRCRGTTQAGQRCQITSADGPSGCYYKARPLCEGSRYCGYHLSQAR